MAEMEQPTSGAGTSVVAGGEDKSAVSKVRMAAVPFPEMPMPLGYEEICAILPHRYPMLLVDRILELEPGKRCVGVKCVSANEEFFQGHFPGHPVAPGVLILEHMAQVSGILILVSRNTPGALSYFASIEKARFRRPVRPGDQVITEATLEVLRSQYSKVHVIGRVDGQTVVEANYTFVVPVDTSASDAVVRTAGPSEHRAVTQSSTQSAAPTSTPPLAVPANPAVLAAANGHPAPETSPAPQTTSRTGVTIHPTAIVDSSAEIAPGAHIGPFCIVEGGTSIGADTHLESHVIVKRGTTIGARCKVWPQVVLGHDPQDMKFKGEESFLRIGDDNMLREMVTIHRATGAGEATTIGNSNLLMAYAHIGHNCTVGSHCLISNSTGISGHVTIEDRVVIGGFVGVHQFVHIGKMAMVGGLSKVVQDVPPFCMADGRPSKTHGLNIRGLRRNGVQPEERTQVASAVKLLYRTGLNTSEALERIRNEIPPSETLDYLIRFLDRVREGRLGRQDETPHL